MKNIIKSLLLIIFFSNTLFSQNMVNNSSFEEVNSKNYIKEWEVVPYKSTVSWISPIVNYINKDYPPYKKYMYPISNLGYQNAHTGKGYIVMSFSETPLRYYRTKLNTKMIKDSLYYVSFYTSLADSSFFAIKNFGIFFSKKKYSLFGDIYKNKNVYLNKITPKIICSDIVCDTVNWTKVTGLYKSTGKEKYLTLGMFLFNDKNYKKGEYDALIINPNTDISKEFQRIVYFFDDISVTKINKEDTGKYYLENKFSHISNNKYNKKNIVKQFIHRQSLVHVNKKRNNEDILKINNLISPDTLDKINIGDTIILKNIFFYPEYYATSISNIQLDLFVEYLAKHKKIELEIGGHVNVKETEKLNLWVSKKQASSVASRLINFGKGIEKTNISYKGYGSKYIGTKTKTRGLITIRLLNK